STYGGGTFDGFVTKLNPTGSGLVYSTYFGGSGDDKAISVAVDGAGNAYVAGFTDSTDFPVTSGAFQTTYGGGASDGFVAKLSLTGSGLLYSTYLGATGQDQAIDIAIDPAGDAHVSGITNTNGFPTTLGAFQTSFAGGAYDAIVAKLNATGSALVYSTYLGG